MSIASFPGTAHFQAVAGSTQPGPLLHFSFPVPGFRPTSKQSAPCTCSRVLCVFVSCAIVMLYLRCSVSSLWKLRRLCSSVEQKGCNFSTTQTRNRRGTVYVHVGRVALMRQPLASQIYFKFVTNTGSRIGFAMKQLLLEFDIDWLANEQFCRCMWQTGFYQPVAWKLGYWYTQGTQLAIPVKCNSISTLSEQKVSWCHCSRSWVDRLGVSLGYNIYIYIYFTFALKSQSYFGLEHV